MFHKTTILHLLACVIYGISFLNYKNVVLRLRMSRVVPLLLLYGFMAKIRKIYFYSYNKQPQSCLEHIYIFSLIKSELSACFNIEFFLKLCVPCIDLNRRSNFSIQRDSLIMMMLMHRSMWSVIRRRKMLT